MVGGELRVRSDLAQSVMRCAHDKEALDDPRREIWLHARPQRLRQDQRRGGLRLSAGMKKRFRDFDRQRLSAGELRKAIAHVLANSG